MEEEHEDQLKKLIQKSGTDKTSADFTAEIMKMVQAEDLARESAFRSMLATAEAEQTSDLFTRQVMVRIQPVTRKTEKPIISKQVWYAIVACFGLVIGYCVVAQSPQSLTAPGIIPKNIGSVATAFSMDVIGTPVLYSITIAAMAILLMADYLVRYRQIRI